MTETMTEIPANETAVGAPEMTASANTTTSPAPTPEAAAAAMPKVKPKRFDAAQPVLEKLFTLYPHLFGQRFVPLKLGVFHDLMAAHTDVFQREELKLALGVHTRSTRYLQAVAAGVPRHDLRGQVVEPVAPEHVFQSLVEVFARRQKRTDDDLLPKLQQQLVQAYAQSGLARADYLARIGTPDDTLSAVLDEAINQVEQQRARQAALVKAYQASGKTPEEFADMFGRDVREVRAALAAANLT